MDEQIARLERLCESDPGNLSYHQRLARVSRRSGDTRYCKVVRDFVIELARPSWSIPFCAQWLTKRLGTEAKDMAPVFALLLDHESVVIRRRAAWVLPEICTEALVPGLAQLLENSDQELRKTAATILERIGPMAELAIPQLIIAMSDNSHDVRRITMRAILHFATIQSPAIVVGLRSRDPLVRALTAETIGRNQIREGLEPLIKRLDDAQSRVRTAAAIALGAFGEDAAKAIPIIIELLDDEQLSWTALESLGQMGSSEAVQYLENCLHNNVWHLDRRSVLHGIFGLAARGELLVEALLNRVFSEGPYSWVADDNHDVFNYDDDGEETTEDEGSWSFTNHEDIGRLAEFLQFHRDLARETLQPYLDSNIGYEIRLSYYLLVELGCPLIELDRRLSARESEANPQVAEIIQTIIRELNIRRCE